MRDFEFHDYGNGQHDGTTLERANVTIEHFAETAQARAHAGKLAKKNGGPVDLARPSREGKHDPWDMRYITTASPSEHHTAGYRFERLDG